MLKPEDFLEEWLDNSIDEMRNDYHSEVESFEMFKEKAKVKGLRAFNDYTNSIEHGYALIIQRIEAAQQGGTDVSFKRA